MSVAFDQFQSIVRSHRPVWAVVLGSGLGNVPEQSEELAAVSFADVPGIPAPTVGGHAGRLVLGRLSGRPLLIVRGRVHLYEGHDRGSVTQMITWIARMGVTRLLLTNAAGGIRADLNPGDLMLIDGHRNLQDGRMVPRLVADEVLRIYDSELMGGLQRRESARGRILTTGVYSALTGPCYETPAEIRALAVAGSDAVGMSTAPEAEAAIECGLRVVAISCITNKAAGLSPTALDHHEVIDTARSAARRLSEIIAGLWDEG